MPVWKGRLAACCRWLGRWLGGLGGRHKGLGQHGQAAALELQRTRHRTVRSMRRECRTCAAGLGGSCMSPFCVKQCTSWKKVELGLQSFGARCGPHRHEHFMLWSAVPCKYVGGAALCSRSRGADEHPFTVRTSRESAEYAYLQSGVKIDVARSCCLSLRQSAAKAGRLSPQRTSGTIGGRGGARAGAWGHDSGGCCAGVPWIS